AVVLLGAFVVSELRSKAPLIRLGIFRVRSLTTANVAMLFVMSGLFGMFYFASIYVQEILGYSPLKAGVAFVPVTVGIVIGGGLGLAILSSVAASRTSAVHAVTHATALVDGFQLAFLVGAGLMLSAIAVIVALVRRRHVASIGAEDVVPVAA